MRRHRAYHLTGGGREAAPVEGGHFVSMVGCVVSRRETRAAGRRPVPGRRASIGRFERVEALRAVMPLRSGAIDDDPCVPRSAWWNRRDNR
ncbi:hypothetical protein GQ57_28760 [Burkholderia sp. MSh2]|nr:hypothetical protein GQ57_28760 [Burkholderia sp. MSh2]